MDGGSSQLAGIECVPEPIVLCGGRFPSVGPGRALRFLTMVCWLTVSGALCAGADSDSGMPLVFDSVAVAVSVLALPSRKLPPLAASAKPAPANTKANVKAIAEGLRERRAARARPAGRRGAECGSLDVMGSSRAQVSRCGGETGLM